MMDAVERRGRAGLTGACARLPDAAMPPVCDWLRQTGPPTLASLEPWGRRLETVDEYADNAYV